MFLVELDWLICVNEFLLLTFRRFVNVKNIGVLFLWYIYHFLWLLLLTDSSKFEIIFSTTYLGIFGCFVVSSIKWYHSSSIWDCLLAWIIEANKKMVALNGTIFFNLWKDKMKDLLFVKKLHFPIFAMQKLNSMFNVEWGFEHKQLCDIIQ